MEMLTLKNGSEEAAPLVKTVMLSLKGLWESGLTGILAVYDLREIIRNPDYRSSHLDALKSRALVQPDGRVHQSIKNVVLSAVEGEGMHVMICSPIKL